MRIGILGGSGDLGRGLALRWARTHVVRIGSRSAEKGAALASEFAELSGRPITGGENSEVVSASDLAVVSVPFDGLAALAETVSPPEGLIAVCPVVPMRREGKAFLYTPPPEGSAAALLQRLWPSARVVAGFHSLSAGKLAHVEETLDEFCFLCGADPDAVSTAASLAAEIECVQPVELGGLELAPMIESLTPLILTSARRLGRKHLGVKLVD